jgi:phosphohistidine phosphatase
MKTLFVMRHAKSSWNEPELNDFDRPLIEQGEKRTWKIVDFLLKKQVKIDLILSSPAVRALETAKIIANGLNMPEQSLRIEKSIYLAEAEQLQDLFYELPALMDHLMIVGHNVGITNFINEYLEKKLEPVPTSAVVCINFDTDDWSQISAGNATLRFLVYPKMLG